MAVNEDAIELTVVKEFKDEAGKKRKETSLISVPFSEIKETKLEILFK